MNVLGDVLYRELANLPILLGARSSQHPVDHDDTVIRGLQVDAQILQPFRVADDCAVPLPSSHSFNNCSFNDRQYSLWPAFSRFQVPA